MCVVLRGRRKSVSPIIDGPRRASRDGSSSDSTTGGPPVLDRGGCGAGGLVRCSCRLRRAHRRPGRRDRPDSGRRGGLGLRRRSDEPGHAAPPEDAVEVESPVPSSPTPTPIHKIFYIIWILILIGGSCLIYPFKFWESSVKRLRLSNTVCNRSKSYRRCSLGRGNPAILRWSEKQAGLIVYETREEAICRLFP